jgi:hypothetical protein
MVWKALLLKLKQSGIRGWRYYAVFAVGLALGFWL